MLFNSSFFIFLFLPITLIGYYFLSYKIGKKASILWLFFMSCVFYGWFRIDFLLMLLVLIVFNFACGSILTTAYNKNTQNPWILTFGILTNLGVLFYFKYANFFLGNVNKVLGTSYLLDGIVLPIGISFFIFQKIAFLIDAYKGEVSKYSFLDFCLFVMFFPQLIAGPIIHHKEFIPQIKDKEKFRFDSTEFATGIILFAVGLCKKILIADKLASLVDPLFAASQASVLTAVDSWKAALGFSLQIYFDFSAYSDMALGLALCFGIRLPLNFNSPYQANNMIDFWRRWHITLSRFLRDYIYIPLGGNRKGIARRYSNLVITMLIGGVWHGAAWTFILWGALHGIYLMINHGWRHISKVTGLAINKYAAKLLTISAVVIAWVLFRAASLQSAKHILKGMFNWQNFSSSKKELLILGYLVGILFIISIAPNIQQLCARFKPSIEEVTPSRYLRNSIAISPALGVALGAAVLGSICYQILHKSEMFKFIYFQF